MRSPPKHLRALVAVAAEHRAAGASWSTVGQHVKRSADACRRWPKEYPEVWAEAIAAAEDRVIAEAGAEALLTLRNLLRSPDAKVARDAAQALTQMRTRFLAAKIPDRPAHPVDDIKELSDAQVLALLDELHPGRRAALGQVLEAGLAGDGPP